MTWSTMLHRLRAAGALLRREGGALVVEARRGTLTAALLAALRSHKGDLLKIVGAQPMAADEVGERAAIQWEGCLSGAAAAEALAEYDRLTRRPVFWVVAG